MLKTCVKCGEEKDLEFFAKGKNYKDGRRGTCKKCHTAYVKQYYKNNPSKREDNIRRYGLYEGNWQRHHISKEKYDQLLAEHDGKCHSCKTRIATSIDHDHACCNKSRSCGKCVRGVLCNQCNTALGLLSDSKEHILSLLGYLEKNIGL
jgi:hypothetical protein